MSSSDTVEETETAEPAIDNLRQSILDQLTAEFGDRVVGHELRPGDDLWVRVANSAWSEVGHYLRRGLGFAFFNYLSAIDWQPSIYGRSMDSQVDLELGNEEASTVDQTIVTGYAGGDTRFQMLARVHDVVRHVGVTLKADLDDDAPTIDSWVPVYAGADWHEREAWEMFGIEFTGHPGLRKLYLPGDFAGNPMRKDFPLLARLVKPWPGIVDVEAMPGSDDDAEEEAGS